MSVRYKQAGRANPLAVFMMLGFIGASILIIAFSIDRISSLGGTTLAMLGAGSLLGIAVATRPLLLLWGLTIYTLVVVGLAGYFFPMAKILAWVAYGAAFLMFFYGFVAVLKGNAMPSGKKDYLMSIALLILFLDVLLSIGYSYTPVPQIIVAVKSMFMFGGLWVFFGSVRLNEKQMLAWLKLLLAIGLIQWLPAIYQYFFVRKDRLAKGLGTVGASDSVVGTFGGSMEGGGLTAVLAFYLVVLVLAVVAFRAEHILKTRKTVVILFFLILPLMLMEVKVIFFYIPVGLVVLFRSNLLRNPAKSIAWAAAISVFLGSMLFAYQYFHWSARGENWAENIEKSFSYSFDPEGGYVVEETGALTRLGAVQYWAEQHSEDNYARALIGHGIGASRTVGQVTGTSADKHYPRNIDRTGLSLLLWDIGVIGTIAVLGMIVATFIRTNSIIKATRNRSWQKALARTLNASTVLFMMSLLYRNDIPYAAPIMFIFMAVLGTTVWLNRTIVLRSANNAQLTKKALL